MNGRTQAVLIGGSAGSVDALMKILPEMPANYSLPIIVVVHLRQGVKSVISEIFAARCQMIVKEADDKESVESGTIYFAPPNYHLMVEDDFSFTLCTDEPVKFSRPAVDVLFETAASAYGEGALGIVLTGASDDGAQGLRAICDAGGLAVVQDANFALAPQMPTAALRTCPNAKVLKLEEIGEYLRGICTRA